MTFFYIVTLDIYRHLYYEVPIRIAQGSNFGKIKINPLVTKLEGIFENGKRGQTHKREIDINVARWMTIVHRPNSLNGSLSNISICLGRQFGHDF